MTKERMKQTILLNLKRGTQKRAEYLKSIFYEVGERVAYQPRVIPLYPELIKLHNNIMIASNVRFVTHDAIHYVLNGYEKIRGEGYEYPECLGCIEIMDNVFVGAYSTILYGVRIGENVIIGSNSLVNRDLAPNGVYAGILARRICGFEEFVQKRREQKFATIEKNQHISKEEIENAWDLFDRNHKEISAE